MDEQQQSKLFIFKKNTAPGKKSYCSLYKLHKTIVLEKIPIFVKVCMQFILKKEMNTETLIFSNKECIFEMNFESEEIQVLYHYSKPFSIQPNFFVSNNNQDIFTVASTHDGYWVDLKKLYDIDIDELFNVLAINQVIYDSEDQDFYVLANKKDGKVGFFLIKYNARNPAVH